MEHKSIYEKKQELEAFCRQQMCVNCPLVTDAYCMLADESPEAVDEAYEKMIKSKLKVK